MLGTLAVCAKMLAAILSPKAAMQPATTEPDVLREVEHLPSGYVKIAIENGHL